jgi:protein Tex
MQDHHVSKISEELNLLPGQVSATAQLLDGGATVPFIARYRKEVTGSLDEVAITAIRDRIAQLQDLDKRRESILGSLEERALLSEDLKGKILCAETLAQLEDIYLPYRPKRRTRATVAREKGLEPLASVLFEQGIDLDPIAEAARFINPEIGVMDTGDALSGARDIVAEWINENLEARERMRDLYARKAVFTSKVVQGKETEGAKYRDYFDWHESAATAPSHRVLALRRGEKEGLLRLEVSPPEDEAIALLESLFVKGEGPASLEVRQAVTDGYRRLLSQAMETEIRLETKTRADAEAIRIFAENIRELLLAPPLGQKTILAIDPGIRTGCKVACIDRQGTLKGVETIYPLTSDSARKTAAKTLMALIPMYQVEAIAVGNGTGGRETEAFLKELDLQGKIPIVMVNESGASVYSASEVARKEFPDLDVSIRGAVSIGRRLMDPLAELVKIDPKSIGVGQYQHDVDQGGLKRSLDDVVVSCVNGVGVEINTASEQLLTYVSGLGPHLAKNIVAHRTANGPFASREEFRRVPRLGPKAFEQAAGFLRIRNGQNPLDGSAVHPESYGVVAAMARDLGCEVKDLMGDEAKRGKIDLKRYVTEEVGMPTLSDILAELAKPGRDPRGTFEDFAFASGILTIEDLQPGMRLPGVVTNVTAFGAFVDIGVHQDGLVHVSQLKDGFVKDPHQVIKVNERVSVTVLDVDMERRRIALSMRQQPAQPARASRQEPVKRSMSKEKTPPKKKESPFNNPFARLGRPLGKGS